MRHQDSLGGSLSIISVLFLILFYISVNIVDPGIPTLFSPRLDKFSSGVILSKAFWEEIMSHFLDPQAEA